MKKKKELECLESYIWTAIDNVKIDRAKADILLTDLMLYLKANPERHEKNGLVASKYLETLQRSNEQLVKSAELLRKLQSDLEDDFSSKDVEDIYDKLQGE